MLSTPIMKKPRIFTYLKFYLSVLKRVVDQCAYQKQNTYNFLKYLLFRVLKWLPENIGTIPVYSFTFKATSYSTSDFDTTCGELSLKQSITIIEQNNCKYIISENAITHGKKYNVELLNKLLPLLGYAGESTDLQGVVHYLPSWYHFHNPIFLLI